MFFPSWLSFMVPLPGHLFTNILPQSLSLFAYKFKSTSFIFFYFRGLYYVRDLLHLEKSFVLSSTLNIM